MYTNLLSHNKPKVPAESSNLFSRNLYLICIYIKMTSRISKGSITGRKAYSDGGLGLSIGTRATRGIRHAIARRAPDTVKISGVPTVVEYQINKTIPKGTYVAIPNPALPPYIGEFGVTLVAGSALSTLFTTKASQLVFQIEMAGKSILLTFDNGTTGTPKIVEQFLTKKDVNVYEFKIPTIPTLASFGQLLYSDGTTAPFNTTTSTVNIKLTAVANAGYGLDAPALALFNTDLGTYVSGKTFTFTMSANNSFSLSSLNLNATNFVF
jgi:hypothetical protein